MERGIVIRKMKLKKFKVSEMKRGYTIEDIILLAKNKDDAWENYSNDKGFLGKWKMVTDERVIENTEITEVKE